MPGTDDTIGVPVESNNQRQCSREKMCQRAMTVGQGGARHSTASTCGALNSATGSVKLIVKQYREIPYVEHAVEEMP